MKEDVHFQDEEFTVKGHWWLPGSEVRVAGDLVYDESSLGLSLYGGLNHATRVSLLNARPDVTSFDIVFGKTLDGTPVTLLKSFYTSWNSPAIDLLKPPVIGEQVPLSSSSLHSGQAIIGKHCVSAAEGYTRCRVEVPAFATWLGDDPFSVTFGESHTSVNVSYNMPKTNEFELSRLGARLRFRRSMKPPGFPDFSPSIDHNAYLELE